MPHTFEDLAVFAAPDIFVQLWASGFIGAKLVGYAPAALTHPTFLYRQPPPPFT